jgi:hypothetical protein
MDDSMTNSNATCAEPPVLEFFTAADAGAEIGCSPTTVKRVSAEIKLPTIITKSGIHLWTRPMLEKVRAELERRRIEGLRR